jgi:hypothetical protein
VYHIVLQLPVHHSLRSEKVIVLFGTFCQSGV